MTTYTIAQLRRAARDAWRGTYPHGRCTARRHPATIDIDSCGQSAKMRPSETTLVLCAAGASAVAHGTCLFGHQLTAACAI